MLFNLISNIMKKILALMVLCTLSMSVSAQEVDSLQSESVSIDSLATKLDKLQHDYDYLYCDYELSRVEYKLENLSNQTRMSANSLLISSYHGRFDADLYIVHRDSYNTFNSFCDAMKDIVITTQILISLKIISCNFTEEEKDLLRDRSSGLDRYVVSAESALRLYESVIDVYRDSK